jgi:hypothetical protein
VEVDGHVVHGAVDDEEGGTNVGSHVADSTKVV